MNILVADGELAAAVEHHMVMGVRAEIDDVFKLPGKRCFLCFVNDGRVLWPHHNGHFARRRNTISKARRNRFPGIKRNLCLALRR